MTKPGKKKKQPSKGDGSKTVATNRKAGHLYEILDSLEAGIALVGPEVKSLRAGTASLGDAYCVIRKGELFMLKAHIGAYDNAGRENVKPDRDRKLLMHRRELRKLEDQIKAKGITLVPLAIYFNPRGRCKVRVGVVRGKKLFDKRESIKKRESDRDLARVMKKVRG